MTAHAPVRLKTCRRYAGRGTRSHAEPATGVMQGDWALRPVCQAATTTSGDVRVVAGHSGPKIGMRALVARTSAAGARRLCGVLPARPCRRDRRVLWLQGHVGLLFEGGAQLAVGNSVSCGCKYARRHCHQPCRSRPHAPQAKEQGTPATAEAVARAGRGGRRSNARASGRSTAGRIIGRAAGRRGRRRLG